MKPIKWKVYKDGQHIDSGTIKAESDKEALEMVLMDMAERPGIVADDCYSITAGGIMTTSFGDEFQRSAQVSAHGVDEDTSIDPATIISNDDQVSLTDDREAAQKSFEDLIKKALVDSGYARRSWTQKKRVLNPVIVGRAMSNTDRLGTVPVIQADGDTIRITAGTRIYINENLCIGPDGLAYPHSITPPAETRQ